MDNTNNLGNEEETSQGMSYKIFTPEEIEKMKPKVFATYGGNKQNEGNSHITALKVQVKGKECFETTSVRLELKQTLNNHHSFELLADPDEFDERDAYLFQNSKELLGARITFQFKRFGQIQSLFTGVITDLSLRNIGGIKNLVLSGGSPGLLMENGKHCRSFENQTFEEIIQEVIKNYPKDLFNFHINPNYKEKLPYICQWQETDFQFIKKLANRLGEHFLYSGEQFVFSAWGGKIINLLEGEDLFNYQLKMKAAPQNFGYTVYDPKQAAILTEDSQISNFQQSENPFQQFAANVSEGIFNVPPTSHYEQGLLPNGAMDIKTAVETEKRKRQHLVYMEGKSGDPSLRIGDVGQMSAWMPGHKIFKSGAVPIESYKLVELIHTFGDAEGYSNTFVGVPKDLIVPDDYDAANTPKADIQHASVTDNKDPLKMGRIRVQFAWQKQSNQQTPWIQVIQPHAGAGKGTYMNPEVGETVLCAFQGGNAEAPIVLGTAYNGGEIATYYTEGNDIKVIQTRSGTKIVFNDAEGKGSILITDPSGNSWFMDGQGNIKVNAPKDIDITAGEDMKVNVGNDLNFTVGNQATLDIMQKMQVNTPFMEQFISNYFHTQAGTALINSDNQIKIESPQTFVAGQNKLFLHSDELATLNSKGTAEMRGETKNSLTNTSDAYEPQREEIKAKCVVMFRPHDKYKDNPNFGFDWLRAGDSGQKGDNWFGNVMGKYYEADNVTVFKNTNSWNTNFKKDMKMYDKLLRSYTSLNISWKDKWRGKGKNRKKEPYLYPIPVLTLLKGRSALFNLKIEIEEKPKKLTFEFKDKTATQYFDLNLKEIGDIKQGKYDKFNYFKITCKNESPAEQILYVKADGEICGALKIYPNTTTYQKKIKVVFVKVKTDINGGDVKGSCVTGGKDFFNQNFNQALVSPNIVEENLNCKGNFLRNEFKSKFCTYETLSDKKTRGYKITKQAGLRDYLEKKLKDQFGTKYDSYYRMYFIGEEANWNGFSYFNSQFGVYFKSHNKATVAHETMHAMNLAHTFDGRSASAHYTYEAYKTNNLLDYSHHKGIERFCLFLWQWKILNSKIR